MIPKKFWLIWTGSLALGLAFWTAVIVVAAHFILKFW